MRELTLGVLAIATVGGGVYFIPLTGESDGTYALSQKDAVSRLMAIRATEGKPPFYGLEVKVTSPGTGVVEWLASGSHAAIFCNAKVDVVSDTEVKVTPSCNGGGISDGAAAGIAGDMRNSDFAEFVDATLDGRPMDYEKLAYQAMGSVMKGLPAAQKEALKMDREMREMQNEIDATNVAEPSQTTFDSMQPSNENTFAGNDPTKFDTPSTE